MSKKHALNLYENCIDSLNVGMKIYNESLEDESMYKFCIMIISNFMELLLKHMVELQNPLLIFKTPYSNNIDNEKTIYRGQALQILRKSNITIEKELEIVTGRLSDLRNKIIHYKFEYDTSEIRALIVLVVGGLRKLYNNVTEQDFIDDVSYDTKKLLETIENEHQVELHLAQAKAEEEANEIGMPIDDCSFCGGIGTAVRRENGEIYCYLCEETDYEIKCCNCTELYKLSEMECFVETENGDDLYLCQHCKVILDRHNSND